MAYQTAGKDDSTGGIVEAVLAENVMLGTELGRPIVDICHSGAPARWNCVHGSAHLALHRTNDVDAGRSCQSSQIDHE